PRTTSRPHSLASFSRRLPSFVISSPPPPSSTLFPYTTLFRSRGIGPNSQSKQRAEKTSALLRLTPPLLADLLLLEGGLDGGHHRDRKSTRLNSSHVKISYAVFCLKKKNKASPWVSCTCSPCR